MSTRKRKGPIITEVPSSTAVTVKCLSFASRKKSRRLGASTHVATAIPPVTLAELDQSSLTFQEADLHSSTLVEEDTIPMLMGESGKRVSKSVSVHFLIISTI